MAQLFKHAQHGLIDECNGNVQAAYSTLIGMKIYETCKKEQVKSLVNITTAFTKRYPNLAKPYLTDDIEWDFKIRQFSLLPKFEMEVVA